MAADNQGPFLDLLPRHVTATNPMWLDWQRAIELVMSSAVWRPVDSLRAFYDPSSLDSDFLPILAGALGFGNRADLFSEDDYRRLIAGLSEYYSQSGTAAMPKFISYANNSIYGLTVKWSNDYIKFWDSPQGTTIYEGGTWFPTPHVDLVYDGTQGLLSSSSVSELFYALAPVHLVLEGIVAKFTGSGTFYVAIAVRDIYIYKVNATTVPKMAAVADIEVLRNQRVTESGGYRITEIGDDRIIE